MNRFKSTCFIVLAILFSIARSTWSGEIKKPTAALIDATGKPVGALLEQKLLANQKAVWLERTEIDKVLRERVLTSLFSPEACGERAAVGRLLKADLLIFLRRFSEPSEYVQMIVCETGSGLRLAVNVLPLSAKTQEDVAQLSAMADEALARYGDKNREICAVPYFVSNDLTFEDDHLKTAYAKLAEETIRDRPGLLVVELEEARGIAKELGLAGGEIRRPMPLYLLGEYRHEGKGAEKKVNLTLRVLRGETELAKVQAAALSGADAVEFVSKNVAELIDKTMGAQQQRPDAMVEARQLAGRAETFLKVGSWQEAMALAEASLLLDGKQSRMHWVAASSEALLASMYSSRTNNPAAVTRGIQYYYRALEHYEFLLPEVSRIGVSDSLYIRLKLAVPWGNLFKESPQFPDTRLTAVQLRQEETDILLRMIRARCRSRSDDELVLLEQALDHWPSSVQSDILFRVVRDVQDLPNAVDLTKKITNYAYISGLFDTPEGREYLASVKSLNNESVRKMASDMQQLLNREAAAKAKFTSDSGTIELERLPLTFGPGYELSRNFGVLRSIRDFGGWFPAGQDMDIIWQLPCKLFVMKDKGRLKPIWDLGYTSKSEAQITGVCFDGQYVWIGVGISHAKPRLFILDPEKESDIEVGEEDGLPVGEWVDAKDDQYKSKLLVEKIEPGRVLLVTWVGRTSMSTVAYDGGQSAKVKTFYKSLEKTPAVAPATRNAPPTEFIPSYIMDFQGKDNAGNPMHRMIVGSKRWGDERPLVVDPDKEKVGSVPETWYQLGGSHVPALAADSFYRVELRGNSLQLVKFGLPDFRRVVLLSDVPEGWCVKLDDRFLVVGRNWWLIDPAAAKTEDRIVDLDIEKTWSYAISSQPGRDYPGIAATASTKRDNFMLRGFVQSNHYGLLAVRWSGDDTEFLRVTLNPQAIAEKRLNAPILAAKKKETLENEQRARALVPQLVRFEPLQLKLGPEYESKTEFMRFGGWIPAEPGIDIFWKAQCNVYVMKEKGTLKQIWELGFINNYRPRITSLTYDGRYVWLSIEPMPSLKTYLYVIDPRTEQVWGLGENDGLPKLDGRIWLEKIEPGKALVVSWLGRMALSTVAFDPVGGAKVNTFFEARNVATPLGGRGALPRTLPASPSRNTDLQMAFTPTDILEFHGTTPDGAPRRRIVLAGRTPITDWPMIVDPDSGNVSIVPDDWNGPSVYSNSPGVGEAVYNRPSVAGETMYRVENRDSNLNLVRLVSPEFKRETLLSNVPEGWCVQYQDRLFVAGRKLWEIDLKAPADKRISVAATEQPWTFSNSFAGAKNTFAAEKVNPAEKYKDYKLVAFCHSNFYGLLVVAQKNMTDYEAFRVVVDEAEKNK
jgi:hypothetical protein